MNRTARNSVGRACETVPMTIDLKAMLERVVAEVFDADFTVEDDTAPGDTLRPAVLVTSHLTEGRTAVIRATYTFLECFIPELDVQAAILDDDDVEAEKEAALRGSASRCGNTCGAGAGLSSAGAGSDRARRTSCTSRLTADARGGWDRTTIQSAIPAKPRTAPARPAARGTPRLVHVQWSHH